MKSLIVTTFLLSMLLIGACSSSTDTTDDTPAGEFFTAKIEGVSFTASTAAIQGSRSSGVLSVAGSGLTFPPQQINLAIYGAEQGGTYSFGPGNSSLATLSLGTTASEIYVSSMSGGSGSVTISKLTATEAEGTFSFSAMNTSEAKKSVTEGKFRVSF